MAGKGGKMAGTGGMRGVRGDDTIKGREQQKCAAKMERERIRREKREREKRERERRERERQRERTTERERQREKDRERDSSTVCGVPSFDT